MFEKFFGRKEKPEKKEGPESIVPNFLENQAGEEAVKKFVGLLRERIRSALDGTKEDFEKADAALKEATEGELKKEVEKYLEPYILADLPGESFNVPENELDRWQVARDLRSLRKQK